MGGGTTNSRGLSLVATYTNPVYAQTIQDGTNLYKKQNYKKAFEIWKPLAEKGVAKAQNNIGIMYMMGKGVIQNDKEAFKWTLLAAKQGIATAQNNLGDMYYIGLGIDQDYKKAFKWISLAAKQVTASWLAQHF